MAISNTLKLRLKIILTQTSSRSDNREVLKAKKFVEQHKGTLETIEQYFEQFPQIPEENDEKLKQLDTYLHFHPLANIVKNNHLTAEEKSGAHTLLVKMDEYTEDELSYYLENFRVAVLLRQAPEADETKTLVEAQVRKIERIKNYQSWQADRYRDYNNLFDTTAKTQPLMRPF